jgi:hypothetical protein
VSTPVPHPATAQAPLLKAGQLGRRHGKAAAYWQIGDSSDTECTAVLPVPAARHIGG